MIDEQLIETEDVGASAEEVDSTGAGDAEPTPEELLEQLKGEMAVLEDRFLRQAAEFQNYRKRSIEERAFSVEIGRSQVAMPMVDVLDDLRRSVEASEQANSTEAQSDDALRSGIKMVYEKFESELARIGIKAMEVVGQPFDEHKHEAMMQQPAPEGSEPGTVIAEVQKGYMIGDKVLRHARVIVAT